MANSNKDSIIAIAFITAICLAGDSMLYIVLPTHWKEVGLTSLIQVGILLSVNRFVRLPKGAFILSLTENIDTSHKSGYHFNVIAKHLLSFQSDVISENTKKGLYEAKQKGIVSGRPKKPDENVQRAIVMYQSKKYSLADIKNETGISKSTLYRYLEN